MNLAEPYNAWIKNKVGDGVDQNTRFVLKIAAATANGSVDVPVTLDLAWFILIEIEDTESMKLDVVKMLLQQPIFLQQFQQTLENPQLKRLLAEFLLFNYLYLDSLKQYIDFGKLDVPIDFISHALLLKRGEGIDSDQISIDRIKMINTVLDTGFNFPQNIPPNAELPVLAKVLSMGDVLGKFALVQRLQNIGFKLFVNNNPRANMEVAVTLINLRDQADCGGWITANAAQFKAIIVQIPASKDVGNLADYYYWVKEDMKAVRFIKETLGIQLSSTT